MSDLPAPLAYAGADARARGDRFLFWYALAWSGLTLFNLVAGGMVTSKGAGLAVPDWPTTYQHSMFTYPLALWWRQGNIFYEHGHRLVASTVGLMTVGMAALLYLREPRAWLRRLGLAALAAVVVQGLLGGMTVLFFLPAPVSVSHAGLAQLFFCTTAAVTLFLSRGWRDAAAGRDTVTGGHATTGVNTVTGGNATTGGITVDPSPSCHSEERQRRGIQPRSDPWFRSRSIPPPVGRRNDTVWTHEPIHSPVNCGARLLRNACTPSRWSLVWPAAP